MEAVYKIPETNFRNFKEEIAKLNKKAVKIGCPGITIEVIKENFVEQKNNDNIATFRKTLNVKVIGETPKYNGWEFVARIDFLPTDSGQLKEVISSVPNEDIPPEYRNRGNICDHCGHKRYRVHTYIVKNDNDEYKRVGSTCLKDFLGHRDPHLLASAAELILSACGLAREYENEFGKSGSHYNDYFGLKRYLKTVAAVIRVSGWCSRARAKEILSATATADIAYAIAFIPNNQLTYDIKALKDRIEYTYITNDNSETQDIETAGKAIEWANKLSEKENKNEYEDNISAIAEVGLIDFSMIGFAASIIPAYQKNLVREKEVKNSNYVGEIKKRDIFDLTLLNTVFIDGMYPKTLHIFSDDSSNSIVWFASGVNAIGVINEKFKVKATVKDHREWRGIKQTVLTRVTKME